MIQNYFRTKLKVSLCMWYTVYRDAEKKIDGLSILSVKALARPQCHRKKYVLDLLFDKTSQ